MLYFTISIPKIFKLLPFIKNETHLSDIEIKKEDITLIFKEKNEITKTIEIKKSDIKSFDMTFDFNLEENQPSNTTIKIGLVQGENLEFSQIIANKPNQLHMLTYMAAIKLIKCSELIPNFNISFTDKFNKISASLDYFKKYGKLENAFITPYKIFFFFYPNFTRFMKIFFILALVQIAILLFLSF